MTMLLGTNSCTKSESTPLLTICVSGDSHLDASFMRDLEWQVSRLSNPDMVEVVMSGENIHHYSMVRMVRYVAPENSFTANVYKTASAARGRFLWIVDSSNSVLIPYAVEKIVQVLVAHSDSGVVFANYRKQSNWAPAINFVNEHIFLSGQRFIEYGIKNFSFAEWDSGKLTYLSSLVINRSRWNAIKHETRHNLHPAYPVHSFMPWCKVVVIAEPLTIHKNKAPSPRWLIYHWLKLYLYMGMQYGQRVHFAYIAMRTIFAHMKHSTYMCTVVAECKLCDSLKKFYRKIFLHKESRIGNQYAKP